MDYVVGACLNGHDDQIKEYSIGLEVFDRPSSFDPRVDPIVRVEASRLRRKIRDYYLTDGVADDVMLELGRPGYHPVARTRRKGMGLEARNQLGRALPHAARSGEPSVAVLTFKDFYGEDDHEFLGHALSDQIAKGLTRLPGIVVASRTYTNRLSTDDIKTVGRSLNVKSVLAGSVQWVDGGLRVRVQLVDAASGFNLWGDVFDIRQQGIFRTQDVITSRVLEGLERVLIRPAARWPQGQPSVDSASL